jgi:hypothetical protein
MAEQLVLEVLVAAVLDQFLRQAQLELLTQVAVVVVDPPVVMVVLAAQVSSSYLTQVHNEAQVVMSPHLLEIPYIPSHHPAHLPLNKPNEHKYFI